MMTRFFKTLYLTIDYIIAKLAISIRNWEETTRPFLILEDRIYGTQEVIYASSQTESLKGVSVPGNQYKFMFTLKAYVKTV